MKHEQVWARCLGFLIVVAFLGAGCAPMPLYPTRVVAPTTEIFLPGLEAPAIETSPLQPTAVLTSTLPALQVTEPAATLLVPSAMPVPPLVGPVWQWVSSAFNDGTVLAAGDPARYTVQLLDDGNALVQADCNFGTGTYEESDGRLSFGPVGATKMACPPDSLDSAFLAQLQNAESYTLDEDGLVISLREEAGTMSLRAAPGEPGALATPTLPPVATLSAIPTVTTLSPTEVPPVQVPTSTVIPPMTAAPLPVQPTPLLLGTPVPLPTAVLTAAVEALPGTSWRLASLTASGRAIPTVGTTAVTFDVDPNGVRISGSTGCNEYRATLSETEDGLAILAPALMTQRACDANLRVQEVEFIDSLLRARSYAVLGDELTLFDGSGNTVMVLERK